MTISPVSSFAAKMPQGRACARSHSPRRQRSGAAGFHEVEDGVRTPRLGHTPAEGLLPRARPVARDARADEAVGAEVRAVQKTPEHALRRLTRVVLHGEEALRQSLFVHIAPDDGQPRAGNARGERAPRGKTALDDEPGGAPVGAGLHDAAAQLRDLQRTDVPAGLAGEAEDPVHPVEDGSESAFVEVDDRQRRTS